MAVDAPQLVPTIPPSTDAKLSPIDIDNLRLYEGLTLQRVNESLGGKGKRIGGGKGSSDEAIDIYRWNVGNKIVEAVMRDGYLDSWKIK